MPNIIEQQDLLKGLPDNRLAMMMQNPTGDIPPFLVAAEAQRRQSIRQQFSGGPQESVVDTLTKQMANVPQNIQAPAQMPPQMPPPQMQQMPQQDAGVAALQGQQQAMRRGGMVQRYQSLGLVTPLQTRVQDIADQFGITVEQAAEMIKNNPSVSGTRPPSEYGTSLPITETNREAIATPSIPDLPALNISPADYAIKQREAARESKYQEMDSYPGYSGPSSYLGSSAGYDPLSSVRTRTASPAIDPRDPNAGKKETSTNNQAKTDISVDEYKKYLEDIYGVRAEDSEYIRNKIKEMYSSEEPSGWESAQKWFAAAQAAIQPGQTNMQSAINALSALSSGYAEEKAADRASRRDMEEALLKQDIADRQAAGQSDRDIAKAVLDFKLAQEERDRSTRSAGAQRQLESLKWQSEQATEDAKIYQNEAADATADLNRHISDMVSKGVLDADISKDPTVISLTNKIKDLNDKANNAMIRSRRLRQAFGSATGANVSVEYADGDTMGYLD